MWPNNIILIGRKKQMEYLKVHRKVNYLTFYYQIEKDKLTQKLLFL